jgi:hypothetical protein
MRERERERERNEEEDEEGQFSILTRRAMFSGRKFNYNSIINCLAWAN